MMKRLVFLALLGFTIGGFVNQSYGQTSERNISVADTHSDRKGASSISQAEQAVAVSVTEIKDVRFVSGGIKQPYDLIPESSFPLKENYAVVIELAHLSWPVSPNSKTENFGGRLAVGFNRPDYSIKGQIKIIGSFDLRLDGNIIGLKNSARVTIKYNFARSFTGRKSEVNLLVDNIRFKFDIPFTLYQIHNAP
jgi:hypothetical protein